jgi:hypothetical protein
MISFRYELEGAGWADAYLSDGTNSATIPASYLWDALRDQVDHELQQLLDKWGLDGYLQDKPSQPRKPQTSQNPQALRYAAVPQPTLFEMLRVVTLSRASGYHTPNARAENTCNAQLF